MSITDQEIEIWKNEVEKLARERGFSDREIGMIFSSCLATLAVLPEAGLGSPDQAVQEFQEYKDDLDENGLSPSMRKLLIQKGHMTPDGRLLIDKSR